MNDRWVPRDVTIVDRLRLRRSREHVEGSASIQLCCPYCGELQTESVITVLGGERVYRCERTYTNGPSRGVGCGHLFIGPI